MFGFLGYGALAVGGAATIYANLPTRLTLGAIAPTYEFLSKAKLIPIEDENNVDKNAAVEVSYFPYLVFNP